ncbi:MAG: uracil-DNA glycosylase [Candidatus Eremiobacteraeota bacterium]|nr:uracil-DNA glycosylase [Candidatus Eremiobacteraeota bacterium]
MTGKENSHTLDQQGAECHRAQLLELHDAVRQCRKCPLSETRTYAVPGEGNLSARVMFVGEGPGAQEDSEGKPFVGAAGRLLGELLSSIGLTRGDVFITNVVKCRPPGNRDPLDEEIARCLPYLRKQVLLMKPLLLCTLGKHALRTLVDSNLSISAVHGKLFTKGNYRFFAMYHPAAALYQQKLKETLAGDFITLRKHLEDNELLLPPVHQQ